ncbi:DUF308 domain-containing protein [Gallalistipes aquisgranensis]|uniref:DUF308 domain-containing protein n=1 Tax=Gallalistipes aquisgranensis TaxID=2779358 RepID=UPI001CF928B5|nr:DUF308 domain-containing protein [Gallalistipes aquisgranensis]MBE5033207.1 DUF308 domain-containing protein [Gallalistipes aquisgranensis]
METFALITGIVFIVFGILQIILFFKIWGMTNDVKRISEYVKPKLPKDNCFSDLMATAKKDIYIGDVEKAKRNLLGYKFDLLKENKYANINALGINDKLIKQIDELLATIDKDPSTESTSEKNVIQEIKNDIPPHNK